MIVENNNVRHGKNSDDAILKQQKHRSKKIYRGLGYKKGNN